MSKRTPYETMKSFSWIYIIVVAFYIIGTIICFAMPELRNGLEENLGGGEGMIKFGITAGVTVLLNLWFFWLTLSRTSGAFGARVGRFIKKAHLLFSPQLTYIF